MAGIYQPVASGTVAAADIAVTLTAGSADVDLSSATIPRNYKGHLLKIYDANNVCVQGFVYTDGAGNVQNIVSTKGGTTQNWAQQGAGFDDTTNCRYEIFKVLSAPVIATGTIAAGAMKMDLTTANAFAEFGVDLSAYQDGRHILALYNTTGAYAALAHISASAPGGETPGPELSNDPGFDDASKWTIGENWTISGGLATATASAQGTNTKSPFNTVSVGCLYKASIIVSAYTAPNTFAVGMGTSGGDAHYVTGNTGTGTFSSYYVATTTGGYVGFGYDGVVGNNITLAISDNSIKKITDCATTGSLLLSTKGGSRGFINKHASFNPNVELTYKVLYVGD